MATNYVSIADLEGLADGARLAVQDPGGAEVGLWEKHPDGLRKDGTAVTVPFRLFEGAAQSGLITDGTRRLPGVGEWYTSASWTFLILEVTATQITYALWTHGRINRYRRAISHDQWHRTARTLVEGDQIPIENHGQIAQWAGEVHAQYTEVLALRSQILEVNKFQVQRPALEAIAARLDDPALDRLLNQVGWARAHEVTVTMTITGQVALTEQDMKRAIKNLPAEVTWGTATVPFSIVGETRQFVAAGGCACGTDLPWLREAATPLLPSGVTDRPRWQVIGVCANH